MVRKKYLVTDGHIGPGWYWTRFFADRAARKFNAAPEHKLAGLYVSVRTDVVK